MQDAAPKFDFYEKVWISSKDPNKTLVDGEIGAVLGRATEGEGWYYTVFVYSAGIAWCFHEEELIATGEHAKREDFYSGESIRVIVDEAGRGSIISGEKE